jgi:hypothetical protein
VNEDLAVAGGIVEDPPEPTVPELQQREILAPALLVHPDGPVSVRLLPAVAAAAGTESIASTTKLKILGGPDYKPKRVVIICDGDILVSFNSNTGSGMRLHGAAAVQGQVEITYIGEIFISLPSGATPVNVGWLAEYWAE